MHEEFSEWAFKRIFLDNVDIFRSAAAVGLMLDSVWNVAESVLDRFLEQRELRTHQPLSTSFGCPDFSDANSGELDKLDQI